MSPLNPAANKLGGKSKFAAPRRRALRSSVARYPNGTPPISRLLNSIRPNAVRWLIVSIIIFSFNLKSLHPCGEHVISEGGEVLPSITNSNPSSPIILPRGGVFVPTTLDHLPPHLSQWMPISQFWSSSVSSLGFGYTLQLEASARICVAASNIKPFSRKFFSTFALASPYIFLLSVLESPDFIEINNRRSSELLSNQVLALEWLSVNNQFSLHREVPFMCGLAPCGSRILSCGAFIFTEKQA